VVAPPIPEPTVNYNDRNYETPDVDYYAFAEEQQLTAEELEAWGNTTEEVDL
jgi:hypothetical protein